MAEALAVLGAVAAAVQFAEAAAGALVKTIGVVRGLREVPPKLARLLSEVEASTSHVESLCSSLSPQHGGSDMSKQIQSQAHLDGLLETMTALYKATQDVNSFLAPMAEFGQVSTAKGRRMARMWKSIVSLKMDKELPDKLERLNRLNINVVRELSLVGLQVQVTTNTLAAVNNDILLRGFHDLAQQLTALSADMKGLHMAVTQRQSINNAVDSGFALTFHETASSGNVTLSTSSSLAEAHTAPVSRGRRPASVERRGAQLQLHQKQAAFPCPRQGPGSFTDSHLDLVLFSIRTYYTPGGFDPTPAMLQPRFWKDCSHSIYLFKISDLPKARRLLESSTAAAAHSNDVFTQGATTALIEILSTLSPVNTAAHPDVRKALLSYLHSLALKQLPRGNPILVVLSRLHQGMHGQEYTLTALQCIVDRLCASLEPTNPLRLHAQKRLIALLRRGRDYDRALHTCTQALGEIRTTAGEGSLQERQLARLLEHIYMDQGDWVSALAVCFDIVGQPVGEAFGPNPDPRFHDECAIWTMEDIAKIYESNGKLDTAIAWLKQARISGGICWGPSVSLEHIHDKLMRLLNGCGRGDEAGLWSTAFGPAARHDCSGQLGQGEGRLLSLVRNGIVRRMEHLLAAVLSRGQATNTGLVVGSTTVTAIPACD
ncbi:hypothetical protein MGU_09062 [Metarhizium guizhouense ARSEF 977]|uniref:Fungal N-terminal domain-containing protein n=1 Tax=Metarhizium guizhouense (strain ARSEF 977) TaxID=1276136 RepID=A0A0B4H1P2_METGA|nr:hypothetical protein MGU_09062 [Metarhizium guizhouense ARSEF 977]